MTQDPHPVTVHVDASQSQGPLKRIWRSIGYDEINWTYTPIGRSIFDNIKALDDGPYWVRNHNIFSSGNLRSWLYCYVPHYLIHAVLESLVEDGWSG